MTREGPWGWTAAGSAKLYVKPGAHWTSVTANCKIESNRSLGRMEDQLASAWDGRRIVVRVKNNPNQPRRKVDSSCQCNLRIEQGAFDKDPLSSSSSH